MAGGIVSAVPRRVNGSFAYRRDINSGAENGTIESRKLLQAHSTSCYQPTKRASHQCEPATRSFVFSIVERLSGYFAAFNRSATAFQLTTLKNAAT